MFELSEGVYRYLKTNCSNELLKIKNFTIIFSTIS